MFYSSFVFCRRRTGEVKQVKMLTAKPDDLTSNPRTHTVEGENTHRQAVFLPLRVSGTGTATRHMQENK